MRMTDSFAMPRPRHLVAALAGAVIIGSMPGVSPDAVNAFVNTGVTLNRGHHDRDDDKHRKGTVWVVNRDLGELVIFDASSGTVLKTLPVGAGAHDICVSERAGKAYITAE